MRSRLKPRGGVVPAYAVRTGIGLLGRGDNQVAVLDGRVPGAGGVVLKFVVAPSIPAGFPGPLARVGCRAIHAVKLVAPGECPAGGCCRSCGSSLAGKAG